MRRTVGAITFVQTWDAENRLATITAGGVITTYTYNGDGQRVKVASGGSATVYVGSTYEVITSTGAVTTYYYSGPQRVAMRTSAGVTWLAGDHLGSASLATNSTSPPAGSSLLQRQSAAGPLVGLSTPEAAHTPPRPSRTLNAPR
jgi:YD repeat-containing protein